MLREAGATAPKYSGSGATAEPVSASDWANSRFTILNWQHLGTSATRERGDVLSDGVHCGFAVSSNMVISATEKKVTKDHDTTVLGTPAVRRYTGS